MLGVRVPIDVRPDANGTVAPGGGGMSVTPDDPARLPPHLRPVSHGGLGVLPVFGMPVGGLGLLLSFRPDPRRPDRHGFVEPSRVMTLENLSYWASSFTPKAVRIHGLL